jgi:AcrR family transcriptional regulator
VTRQAARPASSARRPDPAKAASADRKTDSTRADPRGGGPAQQHEHLERGRTTICRLREAGLTIFRAQGYYRARIEDISEKAGVSRATFYVYFSNKEDLLKALLTDFMVDAKQVADSLEPLSLDQAGITALRGWLDRFYHLYSKNFELFEAQAQANAYAQTDEIGQIGVASLELLTQPWTRRISEATGKTAPDANIVALALIAMIERSCYFLFKGMLGIAKPDLLDHLTDLVLRAVCGPLNAL